MKLFDINWQQVDRYKISDRMVLAGSSNPTFQAEGTVQSNPSHTLTHSDRTISTTSSINSFDAGNLQPNPNAQN